MERRLESQCGNEADQNQNSGSARESSMPTGNGTVRRSVEIMNGPNILDLGK